MSNHYHLVLYINQAEAEPWSEDEVIRRWLLLFKALVLIERYQKDECSSNAERKKATEIIEGWRQRLIRKLQQFALDRGLAWISSGQQLQVLFR
ncbi:hypothetical protein BTA35_0200040 [Oceanospirillum linum]|uniref:Transposase n=2 Tax=Oceanospirillum linum TaxID=966 RepID=A0A1T1HDQ1_OCELI|nr:hypothetical protein BTA35_0200040 [Oceanospirillum linum]